ncbi:MAG TPA: polyprenyl synthetase family protein [Anaerolineales bacterium]
MHGDFLPGNNGLNTVSFFTPVQTGLQEAETLLHSQSDGAHPELGAALELLLSSGGKRIRPALGLLTGQMLGAPHDKLITLAAAVELLHTATLVHDDLIDGALLRRGNPTLNARWSPPATVLTGDFIFARAAKLAADTDHLPLMKLFAETLAVIVNGELTQLFTAHGLTSRENYYKRIYAKTASLIEMTTRTAAMISPVNETVVESMRVYGYNLGMAFQIVDDVLDFTGEQAEVGKPVGLDLLQGLVTLPAIYYAETHPDDPDVICLTSGCYSEHERMERLVQAVAKSSGVKRSLDEAQVFIKKALQPLAGMPDRVERQALKDLACYTVTRKI